MQQLHPSDDMVPLFSQDMTSNARCTTCGGSTLAVEKLTHDVTALRNVVHHLLQSVAALEQWRSEMERPPVATGAVPQPQAETLTAHRMLDAVSAAMASELDDMRQRVRVAKERERETQMRFQLWLAQREPLGGK